MKKTDKDTKLHNFNVSSNEDFKIDKIKKNPSIFIANEFFDAMPIKQLRKQRNIWYEKFVNFENYPRASFIEKKTDIKKIEKRLNFKISQNQNFN